MIQDSRNWILGEMSENANSRAFNEANGHDTLPGIEPLEEHNNLNTIAKLGLHTVDRLCNGEADRSKEVFRLSWDGGTPERPGSYEVFVESDLTPEDYRNITRPEDWELLMKWAEPMKGKTAIWINPTMEGGGVAMMRPPLVDFMRKVGVDAHWYRMAPIRNESKGNPFDFTKLMHNISQRQAGNERITSEGKALHQYWNDENAEVLLEQPNILNADFVVIDDPQPAPLIRRIKAANPKAKIIWRNHIDTHRDLMADPSTPQGEVASYLLYECGVIEADAVIAHPEEKFVHRELQDKTFFAPATIEPFDDMNRRLTEEEQREGIEAINAEIAAMNTQLIAEGRYEDVQSFIDPNRDRLTLIARFDESKGMDKMMELGARVRQKVLEKRRALGITDKEPVQTILIGNGSIDDPSGIPMLEKMRNLRREKYADIKQDIIVQRLRHNYMAINAAMYRPNNETALIAAQMSDAEGCETRITDWINHGVPVVISNRGGMHLQVVEGRSGIVLDYDEPDFDLERGAEWVSDLIVYPEKYEAMRQSTYEQSEKLNKREFTTVANVIRFLRVFNKVSTGSVHESDRIWKLDDMVKAQQSIKGELGSKVIQN